jgi:hypothetical protein
VRAERFYTKDDSGLVVPWTCKTLWLQPPYSTSLVQAFVRKYVSERDAEHFKASVSLFNASVETDWFQSMIGASDAVCFPDHRIQFEHKGEPIASSNRYAQAFFYSGRHIDRFVKLFEPIGKVLMPLRGVL